MCFFVVSLLYEEDYGNWKIVAEILEFLTTTQNKDGSPTCTRTIDTRRRDDDDTADSVGRSTFGDGNRTEDNFVVTATTHPSFR